MLLLATFLNRISLRLKEKEYIYIRLKRSKIYRLLSLRDFKEYSYTNTRFNKYIFPASVLLEYQETKARPQEASATSIRAEYP